MPRPFAPQALLLLGFVILLPTDAHAQGLDRVVGAFLGQTSSEQVWKPAVDGSRRTGAIVGAFVDVQTPAPVLRIRLEAHYARRGGIVEGDFFDGQPIDGEVQTDYLGSSVQAKLGGSAGPVHLFVGVGLSTEYAMRTRMDPVLSQILVEENATVFNVLGSAGAGVQVGPEWVLEVEARWVESAGPAHTGSFTETRNRSIELVGRIGKSR